MSGVQQKASISFKISSVNLFPDTWLIMVYEQERYGAEMMYAWRSSQGPRNAARTI